MAPAALSPDTALERLVGRRLTGGERERVQQPVLDGGEPHREPGHGDPACRAVDDELAEPEGRGSGMGSERQLNSRRQPARPARSA